MKEYMVTYSLNGATSTHYISVTNAPLPFFIIRPSIINRVKKDLRLKQEDKFKIKDIKENG